MVRVISVHHFTSQDVSSAPQPLASAIAGNSLLLSTENRAEIQVRDLNKCAILGHTFQTIDQACNIVYSPVGNCVVTLEGSMPSHNTVRAYTNWDDPKVDGAPIRPRIVSRVTPSLQSGQNVMLDMIEFPQREIPLGVAVCPTTGNLLIAAKNVLVIYKYVIKTLETSKTRYLDFEDCIHIFHSVSMPKELAILEDVVGCLSDVELHVFKIKIADLGPESDRHMKSMSMYSVGSDASSAASEPAGMDPLSSLFLTRRCSTDSGESDNIKVVDGVNTINKSINITAKRQQDSEVNESSLEGYSGNVKRHPNHIFLKQSRKITLPEVDKANRELSAVTPKLMEQVLGPISNPGRGGFLGSDGGEVIVKLVPTVVSAEQDFMMEAEAITLVSCKLNKSEEDYEEFKNLVLKPVFWKEFKMKQKFGSTRCSTGPATSPILPRLMQTSPPNPLQSDSNPHLMSMTLCFTSKNEGYLYHLPGHLRKPGKGCGVRRIATYPFTGPVNQIALEPSLLHALTATGLETYTLKSGYYTVIEAENPDDRANSCPSEESPICLVGLRPFMGAKHLSVSGNHLVLLSSVDESALPDGQEVASTKWTVYSLTLPSPLALYKDIIQLANMNRVLSPHGYCQLLSEAHMVLRTYYHELTWDLGQRNDDDAPKLIAEIKEKFRENCLLLANFFFMSQDPKTWKLCLPYFRMSGLSSVDILSQAKDVWLGSVKVHASFPPGLVYYISEIVLRPVCGPIRSKEDIQDSKLADLIITLLGDHSVNDLSVLVLQSPTFRQFKTSKIQTYIKTYLENRDDRFPESVIAFGLLCVDMGESGVPDLQQARNYLKQLSTVQLSEVLLSYHKHLLLDETCNGTSSFSDFAIFTRDTQPDTFVECLVSLIKSDTLSLSFVLGLFIDSFVSISSSRASYGSTKECSATHNTAMLQLFLETYFQEFLIEIEENPGDVKDGTNTDQLQALHTLVRSYLTSLSVPVRFEERDIDSNMYVKRKKYLDKLPPFSGKEQDQESLQQMDSPEFWCQNSLVKLQSLLCCRSICTDESCNEIVKSFLDIKPNTMGALSLRVLCNDMKADQEANIELLIDNDPDVLLPYAQEVGFDLEVWKILLKSLQDRLSSEEQLKHESWYSAMQEILDHLAQSLTLDMFMEILPTPNPHTNEDFQGHIQMCRKNQQAHQIQTLIVSTGHKLLSTLTL